MSVWEERLSGALALLEPAIPGDPEEPSTFDEYLELGPHIGVVVGFLESSDPGRCGVLLGDLGVCEMRAGRLDEAETTQRRALTIFEDVYGPNHHEVAITLGNLGIVQQMLGRLDKAEQTQQRALTIFEATLGPSHPNCDVVRGNLDSVKALKLQGGG